MLWIRDWITNSIVLPLIRQVRNRIRNIKIINNADGTSTFTDSEGINVTTGRTGDEIAELVRSKNKAQQLFDELVIDLTNYDVETMYPVYWVFGNPSAEVIAYRTYGQDGALAVDANGNRVNQSERFSDGYSTKYHVAGLTLRMLGGDHPWSGNRPHGMKVVYNSWSYMPTAQLFNTHRLKCYFQEKGDTVFDQDTTVRPPDNSSNVAGSSGGGGTPTKSGMYLRGGLHYKLYYRNLLYGPPVLVTEPIRIYDNAPYNRSEWLAPFAYDTANNNIPNVEDIGGLG